MGILFIYKSEPPRLRFVETKRCFEGEFRIMTTLALMKQQHCIHLKLGLLYPLYPAYNKTCSLVSHLSLSVGVASSLVLPSGS